MPEMGQQKGTKLMVNQIHDQAKSSGGSPPTKLAVSDLVVDPSLQPRAALDESAVEEYVELLESGAEFPPIEIFMLEGKPHVVAGFHRLEAHKRASRVEIAVLVKTGTRQDA